MPDAQEVWLTIEAERALYVDRGREIILCDRLPSPVTLVLRVTEKNRALLRALIAQDPQS